MKLISSIMFALSMFLGQSVFASTASVDPMSSGQSQQCNHVCPMKQVMQSLNLSSDQQAKMKAIQMQLRQSLKGTMQQMKGLRSQMYDLIESDTMDDSKLNSLIDQKKTLIGQMIKAKVMAKQQMFNLLTADQKAKFKQMMQQKLSQSNNSMMH